MKNWSCEKCEQLKLSRTQPVLPDSPLTGLHLPMMVIGEAPGKDEDESGVGFVGRAGRTLSQLLDEFGYRRYSDYGCANIVRCRPSGNRKPFSHEVDNCLPYLVETLYALSPTMILAVGQTASGLFWGRRSLLEQIKRSKVQQGVVTLTDVKESLRPYFEQKDCRVIPMPHTSPLAWNRKAPDGTPWRLIGREQIQFIRDFQLAGFAASLAV